MNNSESMARRPLILLLNSAACAATIAVTVPSAYLGVLTALALPSHLRRARPSKHLTRFAVCVPAHDEESVIAATIRSLVGQAYPQELFQVHVVTDNCSDDTASVASAAGATVHVRTDPAHPGKGPALNWLFGRLDLAEDDAVVFVDADTIADVEFLAAMDAALGEGADVAQGYYATLDPDRSPAVAFRYAALACRHHLRPLGRARLGASCGLYGNGMAFRVSTLRRFPWSGHLVEDAEMQSALLLDGVAVSYVPDAVVRAEMPDTLEASVTQHQRWEVGRQSLVKRFVPTLIRKTVSGGRQHRRVYADAALDHLTPPLSVLVAMQVALASAGAGLILLGDRRRGSAAAVAGVASGGAVVAHVLAGLRLVGAPASVYRSLLSTPRMVLWKLKMLKNTSGDADKIAWERTSRND